jgi:hypothetical protein
MEGVEFIILYNQKFPERRMVIIMVRCYKQHGVMFIMLSRLDEFLIYFQFDLCPEMRYAKKLRGIKKF